MKRRSFLTTTTATGLSFLGLQKYLNATPSDRVVTYYGPLLPDPDKLLDLPIGFKYKVISEAGQKMDDGFRVPNAPDGMAAFAGKDGRVILVRNHELSFGAIKQGPFLEIDFPSDLDPALSYDPGENGKFPHLGGTTNLVYNPATGETEKQFLSLTGTDRNCAGGAMPWGSWITCEEPQDLTSTRGQNHGYCFEVKASDDGKLQKPVPLKALGRFCHEAVALDPTNGFLYLTEDRNDGLLYRFIPDEKNNFHKGKLQALAIIDKPDADLRNYDKVNVREGENLPVTWIDLDDVTAPADDLRFRGRSAGAAVFARGEGIFYSEGHFYICCTDGGIGRQGQVLRLTPGGAEKTDGKDEICIFLEPGKSDLLTNGDNLCATPNGHLIICEDLVNEHKSATPHLRGITPDGKIYTLARNAAGKSEFAGSCFSPDGKTLFVNVQGTGHTLAITGPWLHSA